MSRNSAGADAGHSGSAVSYSDLIKIMNIPKVEIDPFNGDPMNYLTFMSIFDEMVDSKVSDPRVKLTRLLQYTSGVAKAAIKNCAIIWVRLGMMKLAEFSRVDLGILIWYIRG